MLRLRAAMLAKIRAFFAGRGVLEVETPLLCRGTVSDPQLSSFAIAGERRRYLQTSPEFAMKRLLAAGSGPIYQVCKSFRQGELGARHNPEFTMLEWYRPGYDHHRLMDEVAALVAELLPGMTWRRRSYRAAFVEHVGIDPHTADAAQLAAVAAGLLDAELSDMSRNDWLDLLVSHRVEPQLGPESGIFLYDFPAGQAALSRVETGAHGSPVARRFELYIDGMEIANGYHELLDPAELERRCAADNQRRARTGRAEVAPDRHLLAAMAAGLPDCAGVAVGIDRLLMLAAGSAAIDRVLAFSDARC